MTKSQEKTYTANILVTVTPEVRAAFRDYCRDKGSYMGVILRGWILDEMKRTTGENRHGNQTREY